MIKVKLRNCCKFIDYRGKTPTKSDEGYILITAKNVKENGFSFEPREFIPKESYEEVMVRGIPKEGDVLFTTEAPLGNVCRIPYIGEPFAVGQRIIVMQPIEDILLPEYLEARLKSRAFQEEMWRRSSGSTVKGIRAKELIEIEIDIPSIDEQRKVSNRINVVKELIKLSEQQLEKYDTLIKSRFVEMFGDPVANPMNWPKKLFLDMGVCKNGMNFHYEDKGININCLGVGDFKDLSIITDTSQLSLISLNEMPSEEYMLHDDDIVFVRSNGNKDLVGRSLAVYPGETPTTFSGFCIRYRKNDESVVVPYLLQVLKTESMRKKMVGRGANIQNLNQQILGTLEIPVPQMKLQEQFIAFVQQVDKLKVEEQQNLEKAQLLFESLMQQYFG